MNQIETANTYFDNGLNCAQAVLAATGQVYGLSEDLAISVAMAFGGGMGRMGGTCGVVSGALMSLGLFVGQKPLPDKEKKEIAYRLARKFQEEFKGRHQSCNCRDLLGMEISSPEGYARAHDQNLFKTLCPQFMKNAVEILQTLVRENQ